jgi:hypothetical protein
VKPNRFRGLGFIKLLTWQTVFCTNCFFPRFDLGLVVQNHVQQGIVDLGAIQGSMEEISGILSAVENKVKAGLAS